MKVAIYSIAKNEEKFVKRWAESCSEADYILLVDTGSTDNTVKIAKEIGVNVAEVSVKPWRFDDARNVSLALVPDDMDYCIALDMDEVLVPGWKEKLEEAFEAGVDRPTYKFVWNWTEDGKEGITFHGEKIHRRHGFRWKHPVHEVIVPTSGDEYRAFNGIEIHHHADDSKPRSQYLPLLEMSVREDPDDDRNAFYYARELFYYRKMEEAAAEFKRHLSLPRAQWLPERAAAMRFLSKCEPWAAEQWLLKAIAEAPGRREPLVDLALKYHNEMNWPGCLFYAEEACKILERPTDYLTEPQAWGSGPYDLAAVAAYNLGIYDHALYRGEQAVDQDPDNERLKDNLEFYQKAVDKQQESEVE